MEGLTFEELMEFAINAFMDKENILDEDIRAKYYPRIFGYSVFSKDNQHVYGELHTVEEKVEQAIQEVSSYCALEIPEEEMEEYSILFLKFFAFLMDIVNRNKGEE